MKKKIPTTRFSRKKIISMPCIFNNLGSVALITGAGGILGPYHAKALLEIGTDVILTDKNDTKLRGIYKSLKNKFPQRKIMSLKMDVTSKKDILKVLNIARQNKININILINNAAIDAKVSSKNKQNNGSFEKFSIIQWNKEIKVGLTGAFLCSQIFGNFMATKIKCGIILNISSDLSVISPDQRIYKSSKSNKNQNFKPITYSTIKTGLVGMTKYLATYWAASNIRVNSLSPGGVFNHQSKEFVRKLVKLIPQQRMAYPDEYVGAVQFLCSPASKYMTGQNVVIDGGRSVW